MESFTHGILTKNMQHCKDSRMRNWAFKLLPILLLPFTLEMRRRNCTILWGESSFIPHESGVTSYPFSYCYHLLRAHPLGSDWVLDLVFADDATSYLYGEATLYPSPTFLCNRATCSLNLSTSTSLLA